MKRTPRTHGRQQKLKMMPQRLLRILGENLAFVVLVGAILLTMGTIGLAANHVLPVSASGHGGTTNAQTYRQGVTKATCGEKGLPACASNNSRIPLKSQSAGDIIAAARQSTLFKVNRSGNGDYLSDISHLGTPQLVQALHGSGKVAAPDFYVIPIFDATGATVAAAELELDASRTSVDVVAIVTYTQPYAHDMLTRATPSMAAQAVQAQRKVGVRADTHPRLVYIVFDPVARQTGKIVWTSGGGSPAEPVWAVSGTDGRDYVVGTDGIVHALSELPAVIS